MGFLYCLTVVGHLGCQHIIPAAKNADTFLSQIPKPGRSSKIIATYEDKSIRSGQNRFGLNLRP
jgi:hypothetical protein